MLYTKEDLEQAYIEGYNNACDELESMLESNEYSLEDECNVYMENNNEDNYTALEQAYLKMLTKDDKDDMRTVNDLGKAQKRNKSQRFQDLKDYAALASKKKDGSYTVDRNKVITRSRNGTEKDMADRKAMAARATIGSIFNRKYRNLLSNANRHMNS